MSDDVHVITIFERNFNKLMKKYKLYIIIILLFSIYSQNSYCQWSLGSSVNYLNLLVNDGYSNFGLSVKAEKSLFYVGFAYTTMESGERTVLADTSMIDAGQAQALSTYSIKSYKIFLGVKNYFVGDYDDDFGFYGLVDISYYYLPITKRIDGPIGSARYYYHILYGENKERQVGFEESETSEVLVTGGVGLGIEKKIKSVYLYSDAIIKMSVTSPNNNSPAGDGGSSMFFPFEFNLGVRVPLNY